MRMVFALFIWSCVAVAASACSLCTSFINSRTFGEELENAAVVVVGRLSNPKLNPNPNVGAGAGTIDLTIDNVLKNDGSLGDAKVITLDRYLPVPDPSRPPRYMIFFDKFRGRLTFMRGIAINSEAALPYLAESQAARVKGRIPALIHYAKYLDHADESIARDAFIEFAKSKDADVGKAGTMLDPALVRRLLAKRDLDCDRLALYAFLLGCCGQDRDADDLLKLLGNLTGEQKIATDGVLAGYTTLRPRDGWKRISALVSETKQPFHHRYAAVRAVRMLQGWRGVEIKTDALTAYKHVIREGDMADLVVDDLRRWQWWELTADIASQLGQPTHRAPIMQHCLIRYAMACPLPEARAMVARARQIDREYVEDQEQLLAELRGGQ